MSDTALHQHAHLAAADPEWVEFSRVTPIPNLLGSPAELRAMTDQVKLMTPFTAPVGFSISEREIEVDPANKIALRIYTPEDGKTVYPLLVYYHGGGWTIGDLDTEDASCRLLCKENSCVVVSVDYRKAPENPFPTAVEDSWTALSWAIQHAATLKGDPSCVLLGGLSAGANLTAVLAQRATETKKIKIHGQILRNPFVCHPAAHPADLDFFSYEQNADAPMLPKQSVYKFLEFYNAPPNDIRISPILAKSFSGNPPAYFQISGRDVLRDDAFEYAEKLEKAGIPVRTDAYPGLPHGFMMFPQLKSAQKCERELVDGVNWLISLAKGHHP